ncbi:peptidase dimerization domain-containing protein [Streptomyces cavernae]|uniref:peptidase dimerization domain-containing protein n=1 Tax=Streptomyces cavernae TaxID=2259034 RepID=UPI000FEB7604|nr:peptidase dimerization domain-containing protein [Streptomyces cavernae]
MSHTLDEVHPRLRQEVADRAGALWDIARALHTDPECAFAEHRAAALLTGELERAGFLVRREVAGMPTAFTARSGDGRPAVALLLEYDALPGLGHACGHNLIAAAGLGAALAVHAVLNDGPGGSGGPGGPGRPGNALGAGGFGSVLAVGTPAEESGGGKVVEVEAGVFDDVDAALMFHPGVHDWVRAPLTAQEQYRVGFHGRAAHPTGNPTEGVDALAALIELFNVLAASGRRLPEASHVQGIVTHGGIATNIVPEYAEGLFGLRAATTGELQDLAGRLRTCAEGVALATGTTVSIERATTRYEHFRDNEVLSGRFAAHLARAGITLTPPVPGVYLGSSDIGNVSTRLPAIHPFVAIMDEDGSDHTPEFAEAAASERAREVLLAVTEALACTAADVLLRADLRSEAWARHRAGTATGR